MLERGKYGVERIRRPNDDMSGGFRWVFLVVALVAAVSLGVTVVRR